MRGDGVKRGTVLKQCLLLLLSLWLLLLLLLLSAAGDADRIRRGVAQAGRRIPCSMARRVVERLDCGARRGGTTGAE